MTYWCQVGVIRWVHRYIKGDYMEVKYVEKGKKGKTCADCKHFEDQDDGMGKCFGHEVMAEGSCNYFEPK